MAEGSPASEMNSKETVASAVGGQAQGEAANVSKSPHVEDAQQEVAGSTVTLPSKQSPHRNDKSHSPPPPPPPPPSQSENSKSSPTAAKKEPLRPQGPPSMSDLCSIGGIDTPTPRMSEPLSVQMREEIKYMFIHEYADGLNKLLETQWYTTHGLERLFANYQLCEQFAGTLDLFSNTKSHHYEQMRWLPSAESKLVWELMQLPRWVPHPNPLDTVLQTVIARLEVLECLVTGRTILRSPTSFGLPQPGMDPRQSHFWKHLGDAVTQSTLCNAHWGLPTVPNAFQNADTALQSMRSVLDNMENRDVLYSAAVLRHLGPRHVPALGNTLQSLSGLPQADVQSQRERTQVAVAKRFLEDLASGRGTTQVIQRLCGMAVRSWSYWRLT